VFVELPEVDAELSAGDACAVVESVKAASDVYSPLSGVIAETNAALNDAPELVNSDPYGDGWLFRIRPGSPAELEELLTSEDYERLLVELDD
jgi:glycine cleavage system H protein